MRVRPGRCAARLVLLALGLGALAGCGGPAEEPRWPVQGKVMLADRPLTTGVVIFRPHAGKGNNSREEPRGKIEADGDYRVFTGQRPGVAPGWYKVGVVATRPSDPNNAYAVPTSLIPPRYNNPEESGLVLEVVEHPEPGAYNLTLQPE